MYKIISKISLLAIFLLGLSQVSCVKQNQETTCKTEAITDSRDLPENIPGETMGQKLESLLFWDQDEKERRFPIMQSIYPSLAVAAGENSHTYLAENPITIEQVNDSTSFDAYFDDNHIAGLIVIQDDKIRLERYNQNSDKNTLWTSYSVAKSVSSMLVGVALKNGDIKDMDDVLENYIPEFIGYDYGKVTVRQLLTMTSGIDWNEDYADPNSDVAQMYQKECVDNEAHILTYMKPLKQVHTAGEHFNYSTGETDLIGILIQKASGRSLAEYLSEHIWKPYGMQQCAFWLSDECSGLNIGGSGLSASLRDFARLGTLMLHDGVIGATSIFSDEWLENARSILIPTSDEHEGGYGYLWWVNADGSYMAQGIFGQTIYINPAKNLIIAQIAAWPYADSEELSSVRKDMINAVVESL